ncbi:DUF397 domain-containing protein [Streptomyces sp. NPDC090032]|uniref:DUF397 domain-containing protein n=1 Tax=Streptomyces sp. NPDC090032 TaxID=3365925 RepID=UPI003803DAAA
MSSEQPAQLRWFKSSYSSGEGGACVEIAPDPARPALHVRDSKRPDGARLAFTPGAWNRFVAGLS